MQSFEVEIKSLLGSEERAGTLREQMKRLDPACKLVERNSQLNHYFTGGSLEALAESLRFSCLSTEKCSELNNNSPSPIRRWANGFPRVKDLLFVYLTL